MEVPKEIVLNMGDEVPVTVTAIMVNKKKEEKHKRRDPRSWENVKKATNEMTEEDRIEYFSKMYLEIYNENRSLYHNLQTREKQLASLKKDKDREHTELTKSILARGQLESLCRELQKQNKLIKEENVARIKEEEDRRREVANTFTERLNALTNLITESKDKSNKVKEENQNMTEKLTELYEQYQQRENHLQTVSKQLELQKKLAETMAKKTEIEHEAERQTCRAEKKALVMQLDQYEKEIVLLQEKNRSLEAQVDLYKSQYSDFESTMSKSNKVFDTFKEEMSRMNRQLQTLETERNDLRKRWQSSVNSLIVLSEQHVALSNEQSALEKRLAMLQKLCRQLQEERGAFLKQLKENNIEPIAVKNVESSEKESSGPSPPEAAKSTQRALKLKQELGKVKEVAALIKLGKDPPVDEDELEAQIMIPLIDQELEEIHTQIETSDNAIEEHLAGDSNAKDLLPKRFETTRGMKGEGDIEVAGPSTADISLPGPSTADIALPGPSAADIALPGPSAADIALPGPSTAEGESKPIEETEPQTELVTTHDVGTQFKSDSTNVALQPYVQLEPIDAAARENLAVRRAPGALDLFRDQIPHDVNLAASDSQSSVATYEGPNFMRNMDDVDEGLGLPEIPSDINLDESSSSSSNGIEYPPNRETCGIQTVSSAEALLMSESVMNLTDNSNSSSSTLEDDIMPHPLLTPAEAEQIIEEARKRKNHDRDYYDDDDDEYSRF